MDTNMQHIDCVTGRTADAVSFLQRFRPAGPWLLTWIDPNKKGIETRTFTEAAAAAAWIEKYNGQRNIYFSVNPATRPLSKKAEREDIAAVEYLHVDIDPRAGEDLTAERERALKLLQEPPEGIPQPTFIVFSGGGYQGFWKLADPIPINGDLAKAEDAKRYNLQLETVLGGDKCHNVDRIMRLPGTVNLPDEKKRKKGREIALAALTAEYPENVWPVSAFTKAPTVQTPGGGFSAPEQVKISGNIARLTNAEALDEWKVPDRTKVIIVQGRHPDETKAGDDSRSAWLFDCVCQLVRSRVPDDVVYSVITDPSFRISESVLDKGSGSEQYALRQIQRAKQFLIGEHPIPDAADPMELGPEIVMNPGRLPEIIDEAESALLKATCALYQRGGRLVRPSRIDQPAEHDQLRRPRGSVVLLPVDEYWLREQMARAARWFRDAGEKGLKPADPGLQYARHLLNRPGSWRFPVLRGVIEAPTLRADGSILQQPGYDPASQLLFDPGATRFPPIAESPTWEDAARARDSLMALLRGFPFASPADCSVAIAALLTALVRPSLRTAPLFLFDAPTAGTGKSMLAELVGILATGHTPAMMSQGKSDDEDEKRQGAALIAGDSIIVLDNCERHILGDFLCSVLTQEVVQIRILGQSQRLQLPTTCMVIATGNNLTLSGDITRRAVRCRLDAGLEQPDARQFDFDPRDEITARRPELVVAGLTILRAYLAAGKPCPRPKMGSFEDWNLVRESLVWLNMADPADTCQQIRAADPRKSDLTELLRLWNACYGRKQMTVSQVAQDLEEHSTDPDRQRLHQRLLEETYRTQFNARSIGRHLSRHLDRVVGDLVLRSRASSQGAVYWVEDARQQLSLVS